MTNVPELRDSFRNSKCTRDHDHAVCKGADCKRSEEYTADMVRNIAAFTLETAGSFVDYSGEILPW